MKETAGRRIDYAKENVPVKGCTISRQIEHGEACDIFVFSLANGTNISAESYEYHKLIMVHSGDLVVFDTNGRQKNLVIGEGILTPKNIPVGAKSKEGCVYTEISFRKDSIMNENLKAGEVFQLKDLLPYQEGRIVNMDLSSNAKMKFVIMSFDAGTGLSEHAAPGEALVFALGGEAVIGYEGKEYTLKEGETFKFDKMGRHSVQAVERFKMALLLVLD